MQLLSRSSSSTTVRLFELFSNFSFAYFLSYARVCIPHSGYVRAAPQHFSSHDSLSFYRFGQDLNILATTTISFGCRKCSLFHLFLPHFFFLFTPSASLNAVIVFASVLHLVGPAIIALVTVSRSILCTLPSETEKHPRI